MYITGLFSKIVIRVYQESRDVVLVLLKTYV